MNVNVEIECIALPRASNASDLRALRTAVAEAVQQHVARATSVALARPVTIGRISQAVAAEVASRCETRP